MSSNCKLLLHSDVFLQMEKVIPDQKHNTKGILLEKMFQTSNPKRDFWSLGPEVVTLEKHSY